MTKLTVRLGGIRHQSFDDGPGPRTVLWLAGCSLRCRGCINPHLWPADSGESLSLEDASRRLLIGRERGDQGVTFLGGEPFQQPEALAALCAFVQGAWPSAPNIPRLILYSGYTFEALCARANPAIDSALAMADALIDGPFEAAQADESLAYRGSRNQRIIDLPQTLSNGRLTLLNWDRSQIRLIDGQIITSPALANRIGLPAVAGRHCGELPAASQHPGDL
jgi:anaerobic ribonucleoside-triphosphate reductase activating protein